MSKSRKIRFKPVLASMNSTKQMRQSIISVREIQVHTGVQFFAKEHPEIIKNVGYIINVFFSPAVLDRF
jgi:hypothetical protein